MSEKSLWQRLWSPSKSKWLLGIPIGAFLAVMVGVFGVLGVNGAFYLSNQNDVCYGCHIGMDTIVEEYEQSVHFKNRKGIQADCADCHVPTDFIPKLKTKIIALGDVYHMAVGTYNMENFEQHRNELAQSAYEKLKAVDSQMCKTCHEPSQWDTSLQPKRVVLNHNPELWKEKDKTCVDCHQGVAHQRPVIK